MGVSVDRVMGVCRQTNNGDRSALAGKYYSGCLCWLKYVMQDMRKSCLKFARFFALRYERTR